MEDTRVVYGATCTFWGPIGSVGINDNGLPCCPHCKGMLFESPIEGTFLEGAPNHEIDGHPGYLSMLKWAKGKCFRNINEVEEAFRRSVENS